MKYLIISFKSRNELYGFAKILKSNGVILSIINSPKSIGSSCMLSIKTEFKNINLVTQTIKKYKQNSFLGVYSFQPTTYGDQILRLL